MLQKFVHLGSGPQPITYVVGHVFLIPQRPHDRPFHLGFGHYVDVRYVFILADAVVPGLGL